jgi:hypothetical protein
MRRRENRGQCALDLGTPGCEPVCFDCLGCGYVPEYTQHGDDTYVAMVECPSCKEHFMLREIMDHIRRTHR